MSRDSISLQEMNIAKDSLQHCKSEETNVGVTREAGGRVQAGGEGEARNP